VALFEKNPQRDPTQPSKSPHETSGEQRVLKLLKFLFQEFSHNENFDTEQMRTAKMKHFVAHATTATDWYHNANVRLGLKDTLGLLDDDVEAVWTMFQDPWSAMALLQPFWHMLALAGQPPIKNIPDVFDVQITFAWGVFATQPKAMQIRIPTKWKQGSPLTNGFLCSFLKDQFDGVLQTLAGNGLDALHDKYATSVDERAPSRQALTPEEKKRDGFGF
jgi:hypothetical protein